MMDRKLIISCEHAGNRVPEQYRPLFSGREEVLGTHRGYDKGASELTHRIGRELGEEVYLHDVSRLLVDLNRSLHNPAAFSEFVNQLGREERTSLVKNYYLPHRERVEKKVSDLIGLRDAVLHISVHTFTPVMDGVVRNADVGFLYDPQRGSEKEFCWQWRRAMYDRLPELKYRMNYPYRGTMDGFSTYLKKKYSEANYWGVELEVNQKFVESADNEYWQHIQQQIAGSLKEVVSSLKS